MKKIVLLISFTFILLLPVYANIDSMEVTENNHIIRTFENPHSVSKNSIGIHLLGHGNGISGIYEHKLTNASCCALYLFAGVGFSWIPLSGKFMNYFSGISFAHRLSENWGIEIELPLTYSNKIGRTFGEYNQIIFSYPGIAFRKEINNRFYLKVNALMLRTFIWNDREGKNIRIDSPWIGATFAFQLGNRN